MSPLRPYACIVGAWRRKAHASQRLRPVCLSFGVSPLFPRLRSCSPGSKAVSPLPAHVAYLEATYANSLIAWLFSLLRMISLRLRTMIWLPACRPMRHHQALIRLDDLTPPVEIIREAIPLRLLTMHCGRIHQLHIFGLQAVRLDIRVRFNAHQCHAQ